MLFYLFFCNITKVNHILHCFIILLDLFFSFFTFRILALPYAYVSIESIDSILLSSLVLNAILIVSSLNKLCFFLVSLCCDFNINLVLFINSLLSFFKVNYANFIFLLLIYFIFNLSCF